MPVIRPYHSSIYFEDSEELNEMEKSSTVSLDRSVSVEPAMTEEALKKNKAVSFWRRWLSNIKSLIC